MFHAKNIQKINLKFSIFVYKSLLHSIVLVVSMTTTYACYYGNQSIFMSNLDFQLLCLPDSLNHKQNFKDRKILAYPICSRTWILWQHISVVAIATNINLHFTLLLLKY